MKKVSYILDLLKLIVAKCVSPILKKIDKNNGDIWLVGERKSEAKDNGYHLFKYIRENHPEKKVYYVIDKNSGDLEKIQSLGNVIYHASLKHYVYYIMSSKLICAHLGSCVPDSPICWKFYDNEMKNKKKIFIQHGITKELIPTLMYENTKADLFICGAQPEYEFVKNEFGYPEGNVQYLGFARFDNLHNKNYKNQILLMPTWRSWIQSSSWNDGDKENSKNDFLNSEYYIKFNQIINSKKIDEILNKHNINLVFYPHYEMQCYIDLFTTKSKNIVIANKDKYDVQQLLKESQILITDYSSVAFDFGYMRKPVIYYQFDSEKYYNSHYSKGYYDYDKDGFGPVVEELGELEIYLERILNRDTDYSYENRCELFFEKYDTSNSERIFHAINNI